MEKEIHFPVRDLSVNPFLIQMQKEIYFPVCWIISSSNGKGNILSRVELSVIILPCPVQMSVSSSNENVNLLHSLLNYIQFEWNRKSTLQSGSVCYYIMTNSNGKLNLFSSLFYYIQFQRKRKSSSQCGTCLLIHLAWLDLGSFVAKVSDQISVNQAAGLICSWFA